MNSFIETLNLWGGYFLRFAWPMLWQSSLLIVVLLAFDLLFRRKVRASIRYALWLVVLIKLCLPPTFASPTSPAWWLQRTPPQGMAMSYTVTYDNGSQSEIPQAPLNAFVPPKPTMIPAAWLLITSTAVSLALLFWLLARWRQITRHVRFSASSERLTAIAREAQYVIGKKFNAQIRLTTNPMSPAVCGLFRPVVLIPQSLAENFSQEQLRAVLLHELIHLQRRDVWLNFLQALLQIFYWWHPLLWLANARVRRVREEAVDDAVMMALRDEAEAYAPTLLEVAKLAFNRPLAGLGLVGILESRSALRQRIERLINFRAPRKAGLTIVSILGILAFTAVALPMGEAPEQTNDNPTVATNAVEGKIEARELVQNGKLLYEMGKFDDAEVKLKAATALDPDNQSALYYLDLIEKSRQADQNKNPTNSEIPPAKIVASKDWPGHVIKGQRDIFTMLNQTRLDSVGYDGVPLSQIAENLPNELLKSDANKRFVEFNMDDTTMPDKKTYLGNVAVTIKPPLINANGLDVLDAIVKGANQPIKYSIEDDDVVFSWKDQKDPALFQRVFGVDTNVFRVNLQAMTRLPSDTPILTMVTNYFATRGIALQLPQSAIFFNDGRGLLFVKATSSDLDAIEKIIAQLNTWVPQIHVKARFIAVPKIGFVLPTTFTNNEDSQLTGILTDPEFRTVLWNLEHQKGVETFAAPEVVTISGRQTEMRATTIVEIVTNFVFQELPNKSTTITPQTGKFETGPEVDIVPYVLSDGYTINLTAKASVLEFLGYEDAPRATYATNSAGKRIKLPTARSSMRVQRGRATVNLRDNQTLVLGNLKNDFIGPDGQSGNESKYFQDAEKKNGTTDKTLFVFITATIVDPAGNRVYSDDKLPFNPSTIPPQPH
jgi:beta-lactamase regulating signal transducer with metallopeptidase domain